MANYGTDWILGQQQQQAASFNSGLWTTAHPGNINYSQPITFQNIQPGAKMAATEGTKYAGAFEILYKFKLIERAKSVVIVAETADRARDIFTKQHADDEKQPRIVAVEETVVTL